MSLNLNSEMPPEYDDAARAYAKQVIIVTDKAVDNDPEINRTLSYLTTGIGNLITHIMCESEHEYNMLEIKIAFLNLLTDDENFVKGNVQ